MKGSFTAAIVNFAGTKFVGNIGAQGVIASMAASSGTEYCLYLSTCTKESSRMRLSSTAPRIGGPGSEESHAHDGKAPYTSELASTDLEPGTAFT